ncbi:hypothetical protein COY95_01530, partial [Candidatus Woesearchaeota archaeon CG_4_10_14_0_8_um_filter_47_5]
PVLNATSKDTLEKDMVFTIEPGIYVPGKFGMRIEDDLLLTAKTSTVLTGSLSTQLKIFS